MIVNNYFKISDLCPLFFGVKNYSKESEGCFHPQVFKKGDKIVVQVLAINGFVPNLFLNDECSRKSTDLTPTTINVNDRITVHQVILQPDEGLYTLGVNDRLSDYFMVTSNKYDLQDTMLIEYYHSSNNSAFDTLFWDGATKIPHYFRVAGGFKSSGIQPQLENETYRDQSQEIHHLYSVPYLVETITFGTACGLPSYYADKINRIFSVDNVNIFNGINVSDFMQMWLPYARNDSAVPQLTPVSDGKNRYWITLDVERRSESIEGIGGLKQAGTQVTTTALGVAFNVGNDIDEGAILQYSRDKSAFVDRTTLE